MPKDPDSAEPAVWYLAQLRPNGRATAERGLARQGFRFFSPQIVTTVRRRGRLAPCASALFPGYLFVAFDPARLAWRAISSTRGVARLVGMAGRPAPVPADLVDALIARCDATGRLRPPGGLAPGERVRVLSGPFAGIVSEVERVDADRRVHLLLDCLGRQSRVTLRVDAMQRA